MNQLRPPWERLQTHHAVLGGCVRLRYFYALRLALFWELV